MNIDHMTTYLEVVKRGSFSGAAKHLGLTQPGVSQQIRRLENDVGVPLLDRRERRVVMTGAGREFQRFASRVLAARSDFDEKLKDLTGQVSGRLALGASTVPGEFILPGLLAAFIALHPAVEASVEIGDTGNITDMVRTAECDLGFVGARVSHRGMKQESFLEDELVLIVPSSHPLAEKKSIAIADLGQERLITRERGSGTMQNVYAMLEKAGFDARIWRHAQVFGSTQAIISAVEAGLGVAFVSDFAARSAIASRRISGLRIEGVPLKRQLYITYLDRTPPTRLQREFLSFSLTWAKENGHIPSPLTGEG